MKRITFDGNFCDIAKCADVCEGMICEDDACSQRKTWERLKAIEDILGNEYDLDRLRELAQADREGRCVVLPCKLGNKVYFPLLGRIIKKTVYSIVTFSNSQRIYCDGTSEFFRPENFGKTVFPTRAAAEKALEKEENRNG